MNKKEDKINTINFKDIITEDLEQFRSDKIRSLEKKYPKIKWKERWKEVGNWWSVLIPEKHFVEIDPTERLTYLDWIAKQWNDIIGGVSDIKDYEFVQDLYKIKEYLTIYDKVKPKLDQDKRNIYNIKHYKELFEIIKPFYEQESLQLSKSEEEKLIKNKEAEKVYEDDKWTVVIPNTERASCLYGKGTQWCTAADIADNKFDYYNNQGPLYILINKQTYNRKYQFHFETDTFMDEDDSNIDLLGFLYTAPELMSVIGDKTIKNLLRSGTVGNNDVYDFAVDIGSFDILLKVLYEINPSLTTLDLSMLDYEYLPEEIGLFTNSKKLDLSYNNLKELPESLKKLVNLEYINLYDNNIEEIPEVLFHLPNLLKVDLGSNHIEETDIHNEITISGLINSSIRAIDLTSNPIERIKGTEKEKHILELTGLGKLFWGHKTGGILGPIDIKESEENMYKDSFCIDEGKETKEEAQEYLEKKWKFEEWFIDFIKDIEKATIPTKPNTIYYKGKGTNNIYLILVVGRRSK